jgi:hypothetical protein
VLLTNCRLTWDEYVIRSGNKKPRLKSKLYIFNSFGMIGEDLEAPLRNVEDR